MDARNAPVLDTADAIPSGSSPMARSIESTLVGQARRDRLSATWRSFAPGPTTRRPIAEPPAGKVSGAASASTFDHARRLLDLIAPLGLQEALGGGRAGAELVGRADLRASRDFADGAHGRPLGGATAGLLRPPPMSPPNRRRRSRSLHARAAGRPLRPCWCGRNRPPRDSTSPETARSRFSRWRSPRWQALWRCRKSASAARKDRCWSTPPSARQRARTRAARRRRCAPSARSWRATRTAQARNRRFS